jgi:hypothetical protein
VRSVRTSGLLARCAAAALTAALALGGAGCVPVSQSAPARVDPATSRRQLDELTVARPASMRGYSRARFPHWASTGDNCDVRDSVLRRDGSVIRLRGCNVVGGRWLSPYDERVVTVVSMVDVDHMVPLANAWRSGAARWTEERREAFANDLRRPQLLAVTRAANRAKGDQDPAQWQPPNRAYRCLYAQDWIAVKHHWRLTLTTAEKIALLRMLETCQWPTGSRTAAPTSSPRRVA